MSARAIKKHDRDHIPQARVREHKNTNWQDWTPCEMYGHSYEDSACRDCGTERTDDE
jgi:hypothetical protein